MRYIIGIDQSTQGTKALLFDGEGKLVARADRAHKQKISPEGYVSHDPGEIYANTLLAAEELLRILQGIPGASLGDIAGIGISNQRETTVAWNRENGKQVCDAIVWQCARGAEVCGGFSAEQKAVVAERTGIPLSPYFPAAKMRWILQRVPEAGELAGQGKLCMGTIDSWLLFCMTGGKAFKTDYSNASRTQLFDLHTLTWNAGICDMFGVPVEALPQVCDSNTCFGWTDLGGRIPAPVPIHAMMGDSHGALYGQGCHEKGGVKATYGTGSSLMMNIGDSFRTSRSGLVTSLAWGINGRVDYVLEGNLNYTGAVITWLKDDLGLIGSPKETEGLALSANPADTTYLVPAFSGMGAPYWNSNARALLWGMSRSTGKKELVRAALDCIAYQVTDILRAMEQDIGVKLEKLCVDGGPVGNRYLMQLQSDMAEAEVLAPGAEELSGIGAAYLAGISLGVYDRGRIFRNLQYSTYQPQMSKEERDRRYQGWLEAVGKALG